MWELRILELLIAFFLLLPLIRPFIKGLWTMDGLAVLPILALGIAAGLFPAYGIRPECFPLIVYAIILNIANLPALSSVLRRLKNDNFRDRGPLSTGIFLGLLVAVTALAVYFVPSLDVDMAASGVHSTLVRDTNRNVDLFLRIYRPDKPEQSGKSALLMLIPPAAGSLLTVDRLCGELSQRGFVVLTYSRKGIDAPAVEDNGTKHLLSLAGNIRLLRAIFHGTTWAAANNLGRSLEEERKQDLEFLLSSLKNRDGIGNLLSEHTNQNLVFIAGFGAGGAAVVSLAASPGFAAKNPAVRGIIGLESPILSALGQESPKTLDISRKEAGWLQFFWANSSVRIANLKPRKVKGIDQLPLPEVPTLFILSDRALYSRYRERRYMSALESFRKGASPAALVMVPGAGPLDYSDAPEKYPLLSLLLTGDMAPVWTRADYLPGTASLIINFAAAVEKTGPFKRTILDKNIYININRAWNMTPSEYILGL